MEKSFRRKLGLNELSYKCNMSWSTEGWKRFAESIGGRMPKSCPPSSHTCGAEVPGLFAGSHPTTVGNKSSALVCFSLFGYCCFDYVSVQVTNCGLQCTTSTGADLGFLKRGG